MKPAGYIVFCSLLTFCLIIAGCDDNPVPKPPVNHKESAPAQPFSEKEDFSATPEPWPPVGKDNVETASELLARNYYVILDCSGSMKEKQCSGPVNKLAAAKAALKRFVTLVPEEANLGLMIFVDTKVTELVPLAINNRHSFVKAVDSTYASGNTPLKSAITKGYDKLTEQATKQLGYGEYTLVIVTDGLASEGEDPTEIVLSMLNNTPIEIHTIGFCIGTNHSLNIPGKTVYKAADNPASLQRGLEDVLAESETFDVSAFSFNN